MRRWRFPLLIVMLILLILAMRPVKVPAKEPPNPRPKRPTPPPPVYAGMEALIPEIIELQNAKTDDIWVPDWYIEKIQKTDEAIRRADHQAKVVVVEALDSLHRLDRAVTNAVSFISGFFAGVDSVEMLDAKSKREIDGYREIGGGR